MRQHGGGQVRRIDGKRLPIAKPQLLQALKQSAIDQDLVATGLDEILRPGHRARGPKKRELCHNVSSYGTAFRVAGTRRPPRSAVAGSMTAAQVTPLTVDDIYSYEGWTRFNGSQAATMAWVPDGDPWLNDTEHLWPSDAAHSGAGAGEARGPWLRVDAASGASAPLYTYEQLERALGDAGVQLYGGAERRSRASDELQPGARCAPHHGRRRPLHLQHLHRPGGSRDRLSRRRSSRPRSARTAAASRSSRTTISSWHVSARPRRRRSRRMAAPTS